MSRYDDIIAEITGWANEDPNLRLVVVFGSQARTDRPADEWSDLDIALFFRQPEPMIARPSWLERFGRVTCTFFEGSVAGPWREQRVLYADGRDVDFVILSMEAALPASAPAILRAVLARGFRVTVDKDNVQKNLAEIRSPVTELALPDLRQLENDISDFLFHLVWTTKKLARGELWTALGCINGYLSRLLLRMLTWSAMLTSGSTTDTWHEGRFLEQWTSSRVRSGLAGCFTPYSVQHAHEALDSVRSLYLEQAEGVCRSVGLAFPRGAAEGVARILAAIREASRGSAMRIG